MKNKAIKTIVFCVIIVASINAIAQPSMEDALANGNLEDTTADATTTPINSYIIPMLLIGIIIGYRFRLLKQKKQLAK
jgi:hypothetical protein